MPGSEGLTWGGAGGGGQLVPGSKGLYGGLGAVGSWGWDGNYFLMAATALVAPGILQILSGEEGVISPLWGLSFGLPCGDNFLSYLNSGNV